MNIELNIDTEEIFTQLTHEEMKQFFKEYFDKDSAIELLCEMLTDNIIQSGKLKLMINLMQK